MTAPFAPLAGIRVIDLSRALAGPHAAMLLGDLGAHVIKVEAPDTGDDTRGWGPPFMQPDTGDRESTYFLSCNRNKDSISLDLKSEPDAATLAELVRRADVLIENFRPGVLDRLGFTADRLAELNPRLVTLSISGFGHDGPEAGRAGYDQIAQGEAGLMSLTGPDPDHPQRVGVPVGDLTAGIYGAYGVLAALRERDRTGRGQLVRTSLLAALVGIHAFQGTAWTVAGEVGRAQGNRHPSIAPYGAFRCADGLVQIACGNETMWRRLCARFGLDPDDPDYATNTSRLQNIDALTEHIERRFADLDRDTVLAQLTEAGIPAGRIRTIDEVYQWEQTRSQRLTVDVKHETLGTLTLPGMALRTFDMSPAGELSESTRLEHEAPPLLDADGPAIRGWLR
ncbi:CoA-transferase [Streptomyces sp. AcH 505]|uniref:CaiB/BaiF CoA transferase family protein n=1 Tax=Streptomyces sp. AcH 505 TaxID=352211 RepID=UPI000592165E|nr:CoA-transferase [Streptomyces sp. AcH 505]